MTEQTILECLFPLGVCDYAKYLNFLFTSVLSGADEIDLEAACASKLWVLRTPTSVRYFDV